MLWVDTNIYLEGHFPSPTESLLAVLSRSEPTALRQRVALELLFGTNGLTVIWQHPDATLVQWGWGCRDPSDL